VSAAAFADRLLRAVEAKKSCLVVGIDPVEDRLPPEVRAAAGGVGAARSAAALGRFGRDVVGAVAASAVAVKPNIAFFERFGPAGLEAFQSVCARAREAGLLVIADAKRGDLESTAEAYADAFLGDLPGTPGPLVDAITLNPYMGTDSMKPFLKRAREGGRGLFILVRTSNPSAAELQDQDCGGRPLYLRVADLVARWGADLEGESGFSAVGAVVGATVPRQAEEIRSALPRCVFLVPGYGAQGAGAAEVRPHFLPGGRGAVVNSSRGILLAHEKDSDRPWQEAVARAAERARLDLESVRTSVV